MKKNVLRIGLATLTLFLILAVTGSTFAAEVAHRRGRGYYPPPIHHHYRGPHWAPPPPHYRPHYRPYYRPYVVPYYTPGFHVVTPRAAIGIHF